MKQKWSLKEFISTPSTNFIDNDSDNVQLFHHGTTDIDYGVWFLSGFQGTKTPDSHVGNLILRTIEKGVITPKTDVFVTPTVNPSGKDEIFSKYIEKTLKRWAKNHKPKLVITFSTAMLFLIYV